MLLRLERQTDILSLAATAALVVALGMPRNPVPEFREEPPPGPAMEVVLEEPAEAVPEQPPSTAPPELPRIEMPPPEEPPPVEEEAAPPPPVDVPVPVPEPPPPPAPPPPRPLPPRPTPPRPVVPRPVPAETPPGPPTPRPAPAAPASAAPSAASIEGAYLGRLRGYLQGIAGQSYPTSREARMQRPAGDVVVKLRLSRGGELLEASIFRPASSPILNQHALTVARRADYSRYPFPAELYPGQPFHEFTATLAFTPP